MRSRRDWIVALLAVLAIVVASEVLLWQDAPWPAFGVVLLVLWALLMLYYRGRLGGQRDMRSRQR
jgi:carbon starvation protein CstA